MSDWPVFGSEAGPIRESNPSVADSGPTAAILGRMPWQTTKPDQQIWTRFSKSKSLEFSPFEKFMAAWEGPVRYVAEISVLSRIPCLRFPAIRRRNYKPELSDCGRFFHLHRLQSTSRHERLVVVSHSS